MADFSGNLHSLYPLLRAAPITVGNGATLPVTHQAATLVPTSAAPLYLRNILVSPDLIKNLVSVHSLTRDNNVSVVRPGATGLLIGAEYSRVGSSTWICPTSLCIYPNRSRTR